MSYPTDIPSFRAALLAYSPAPDHADAIYAAQATASVVPAAIETFNALKAAPDLSQSGLSLLIGAAFLMTNETWNHGLGTEPLMALMTRAGQLVPVQVDEPPQP